MIWNKDGNTYTRYVIAPKFSRGFACGSTGCNPICLLLTSKHYTALVPPPTGSVPHSWLRETPDVVIDLSGGVGGVASGSAGLASVGPSPRLCARAALLPRGLPPLPAPPLCTPSPLLLPPWLRVRRGGLVVCLASVRLRPRVPPPCTPWSGPLRLSALAFPVLSPVLLCPRSRPCLLGVLALRSPLRPSDRSLRFAVCGLRPFVRTLLSRARVLRRVIAV